MRDGDLIEIVIDREKLDGSVNLVGAGGQKHGVEWGDRELAARPLNPELKPDEELPDDTRLWAALADASGGTWAGCVYDPDRIIELLEAGKRALGR